jgi:hypothetical protein
MIGQRARRTISCRPVAECKKMKCPAAIRENTKPYEENIWLPIDNI